MDEKEYTHIAFSDEAYYNNQNYSSISLISMDLREFDLLDKKMKEILLTSGLSEFKWSKLRSAKYRLCAEKIIDLVFDSAKKNKIRVDVVIWNSRERKAILPEDNIKLLNKMYYHLIKNVLSNRWPSSAKWKLFPDQQREINWDELKNMLGNVSSRLNISKGEGGITIKLKRDFHILNIEEVDSSNSPLCQIADFFTGFASFYHLECPHCNLGPNQENLNKKVGNLSNSQEERFKLLNFFKAKCKKNEMEIIFDLNRGIKTIDPNSPINFWPFKVIDHKSKDDKLTKFF